MSRYRIPLFAIPLEENQFLIFADASGEPFSVIGYGYNAVKRGNIEGPIRRGSTWTNKTTVENEDVGFTWKTIASLTTEFTCKCFIFGTDTTQNNNGVPPHISIRNVSGNYCIIDASGNVTSKESTFTNLMEIASFTVNLHNADEYSTSRPSNVSADLDMAVFQKGSYTHWKSSGSTPEVYLNFTYYIVTLKT